MKTTLTTVLILSTLFFFSCTDNSSKVQNEPKTKKQEHSSNFKLDSIFPVANIQSITVTNFYGEHTLTKEELKMLKSHLKASTFTGGLLVKPGHVTLKINLKDEKIAKSGFVYASKGYIHFDGGVDKFKNQFSGSFILPSELNFDNYK